MNIKIVNGAVTIGSTTILEEVNMDIKEKDKIAIVGRNGAGKTTLLKALMDPGMFTKGLAEEEFKITNLGKYTIGYLEQITFSDLNISLIAEIKKVYQDLINMAQKLDELVKKMNENNSDELILEYTELQEHFNLLGGYSYQEEYEVMLKKFGFQEADKLKKLKDFSGGERGKIAFIKLLLSKPDLLILDEPTNNLDLKTIEYLEKYLQNYPKTLIVVSHDRQFLDNIVNIVYDIEYGKVTKYVGNYTNYEILKKQRYELLLKNYEYQQKEIKRLYSIYERFRNKPTKASMALSRLKQIEKMDLKEKPNKEDLKSFSINLSKIDSSNRIVLQLQDLEFGYTKALGKLNLEIERGQRIGIIGENGAGKSTLLKTIVGQIPPLKGSIIKGNKVSLGYLEQFLEVLSEDATVLEEFHSLVPNLSYEQTRQALGSFLFKGDDVFKKIVSLSGGEIIRLKLCAILCLLPNVLILDEPTNHLDIVNKENLENLLKMYPGTIIFVSHDRYFIKKLADSLIVLENGLVNYYPYGYQEYITKKNNKEDIKIVKKKANIKDLNKELKMVEKVITKKELELKELKNSLLQKDIYYDYLKGQNINQQIIKLEEEIKKLEDKWEKLSQNIE